MEKVKLGDIIEVTRGTSLAGDDYSDSGTLVRLTLGNFDYVNNVFKVNTSKEDIYYTGEVKENFILKEGDIITPLTEQTVGLLGSTARIPESGKYIQSQDVGLVKCISDKIDDSFIYYLLSSHSVKKQLGAGAQQTSIRHTSPDKIKACQAWIPTIEQQRKIGDFMATLDAKIALNRRMNEELEGMAKMLYDYWFVQFDFPNEEGKPYKSSGGAMEYNAVLKREIPAGWKVEKLTKIADTYSGGTPNSTTAEYYQDGDIPWINSGEINHPIITKTDNYITELGMNNSSAKKIPAGAILVAMYGATAGKSSYLSFDATTNQAVCGVVPHKEYLLGYIQLYLSSLENYFSSISTGSARRNISQDLIRNTPIVIPSEKIISIFYQQHGPILRQRVSLQQEIEHLTVLRDKLLPLLMNGQVRVAD